MSELTMFEIRRTINDAKDTIRNADDQAQVMADILRGRLRHVSGYILVGLKRELRDFNMHTKTWKE